MAKAEKEQFVGAPTSETYVVKVVGQPPGLLMRRFGEKAKKQMEEKQQKVSRVQVARDPEAEYQDSLYRLKEPVEGCEFGFPARGFKACLVNAAMRYFADFKRQSPLVRGAIFVHGERPSLSDDGLLVPIEGNWTRAVHNTRLKDGTAQVTYRPCFEEWSATLRITIDTTTISKGQLEAFIRRAGMSVGIGDARVEKCEMDCGQFSLVSCEAA